MSSSMTMSMSMTMATSTMGPSQSMTSSSTMSGMSMPMSTGSSMSDSVSLMGMENMAMTFFTSSTTPLFSMAWQPHNLGQYAGTCIFCIVLATTFRALLALRVHVYPLLAALDARRHGGIALEAFKNEQTASQPWRARDAVLVAFLDMILASVGYLL